MVEYLWDSVVQSPWSPNVTDIELSFMLALFMSLGFHCCWFFLWWLLPSSWLTEGHSIHNVLYSVVQVWTGCVEAGSSMCTRFWGFSLALVQFFVLSKFLHHLVLFPYQSWVEVRVASTPFFTFIRCYLLVVPLLVGFLFQQLSGVHSFNLLFFVISGRRKVK